MAIVVKEGYIRFKNKSYKIGETIEGLSEAEEDRLISAKVATRVAENGAPADHTPPGAEPVTSAETPTTAAGPATSMPPVTPAASAATQVK